MRTTPTAPAIPAIASRPSRPIPASIQALANDSVASVMRRPDAVRAALYSPGMVGLGHMRRNLLIAQTLVGSHVAKTVLLLAEAREANAFAMPRGVDCLSLPALCKVPTRRARYLSLSFECVVELRAKILRAALESFEPDVLVVDHLPRGAADELDETLERLRSRSHTRCVLGLRDVLDEPRAVRRDWDRSGTEQAIRDYYDAIWIYGDPRVYDPVLEYDLAQDIAAKVRYTGYLDHRARLKSEDHLSRETLDEVDELELPPGRLILCLLGGGQDGGPLAEAFAQTRLPEGTLGLIVTGPYMPAESRERVRRLANGSSQIRVLNFLREPSLLLRKAESVIAMGGYNTTWEALSFGKRALLVPRMEPSREQWVRAKRLEALGLVDVLSPEAATPASLSDWLARAPKTREREVGAPATRVAFDGLDRLPALFEEVLYRPKRAVAGDYRECAQTQVR